MQIENLDFSATQSARFSAELRQDEAVLFSPNVQLRVLGTEGGTPRYACNLSDALPAAWLPRGGYRFSVEPRDLRLEAGDYKAQLTVSAEIRGRREPLAERSLDFSLPRAAGGPGLQRPAWSLSALPGTTPVEDLAWNQGNENWFFSHFDHAATVVTDYLLKRHPLLRGRILDVGCGDGIIDLGIFQRMQPEELVGIDPFKGYERLPGVIADNHLPADVLQEPLRSGRLCYRPEDGNAIPYPDDHFDVVISWGSLEHIAGGYHGTLREIRRVLKRDGLLFVHPGLYYGALGNHLGEFFDDPFIHLKLPPERLRAKVLESEPKRMDRAGHIATPEEYWQWFTELNPIRVQEFERELRELGFEPWRVALRSSDIIEYTPELQNYPMQDLATVELYLSAWNRKR